MGKVVTLTCNPGGTQRVQLVGPCSSKADIFVKRVGVKRGFPGGASSKQPDCQCRRLKRHGFDPWVRKIPWRRAWHPMPSSILAWRIPWTEGPGGLLSVDLQSRTRLGDLPSTWGPCGSHSTPSTRFLETYLVYHRLSLGNSPQGS